MEGRHVDTTRMIGDDYYTKFCIWCHLLFGITECYNYFIVCLMVANKGQFGCLDIIEHCHLYLVKKLDQ